MALFHEVMVAQARAGFNRLRLSMHLTIITGLWNLAPKQFYSRLPASIPQSKHKPV